MSHKDLENAFSKYGTVTEAVVVEKYGFVHMTNREDARIAISRLNKMNLNGCIIEVMMSTGENRRVGGRDAGRRDDRRDSYYDEYYDRRDSYSRRPPPPDPYYRDRCDDPYSRRPPLRHPYDEYYRGPPPARADDRYRAPRDSYPYDRPASFERDVLSRDNPRGRYPLSPRRESDRYDDAGYSRRDVYPPSRSEYSEDLYNRRSDRGYDRRPPARQDNFADDSYAQHSRPGPSSRLYTPMNTSSSASEYPGEKRPVPGLMSSSGYDYHSGEPAPKRTYGGASDLIGYY